MPPLFPFTTIVSQDQMRRALLLNADERIRVLAALEL